MKRVALCVLLAVAACSRPPAETGPKRMAIITPSHDNPFFKAEEIGRAHV